MKNSEKFIVVVFFILLAAGIFLHWREQTGSPVFEESRMLMDTIISIRAWPETSRAAVDRAFNEFVLVEKFASFHLPDSELSRLNTTGRLEVSASLSELLDYGNAYYEKTLRYFDPSFAILQKAWGFYSGAGRIPEDAELAALLASHCGLTKVLHREGDRWLLASGSLLDLGGIAGGYAIGRAKNVLRQAGCTAFLIDDAGDIWFEGSKPDGSPWRIAVRDPRDNGALAYVESFSPLAVSTSGDYERFVTVDGKNYGHIMNPLSGRPVDYYSSVTVIASDAITADALSTALFAMPPEQAFVWADEQNTPALFLTASGVLHVSAAGKDAFSQVRTP